MTRGLPFRALLLLAALIAGCAQDDAPATAAPTATTACAEVETPPLQGGEHLIGDQEPPVPYSSVPPTSGWHSSGALHIGVHGPDDLLSEPDQVGVLEAGGVVVSYRDLPEDDVAALESLARDDYPGRLAVTPYAGLEPGEVAMTGWGVLQRCTALDPDAVAAFADHYADAEPATPGAHH